MNGDTRLYQILSDLEITFEYHEHPPAPTIEAAMKYLGLTPGSVSPFGLINDKEKHVHLFLDESLKTARRLSFHPNINTASL